MNLSVAARFLGACVATLSAAASLAACSSPEEHHATPVQSVAVSADPANPPKEWATDQLVPAAEPYQDICLDDLYSPGKDGKMAQFAAVGLVDPNTVIGIITSTAGADPNSGRIGIAVVPASGTGVEVVQWNLSVDEANSLLREQGLCTKS